LFLAVCPGRIEPLNSKDNTMINDTPDPRPTEPTPDIDAPIQCPGGFTTIRQMTIGAVAGMRADGYTDAEINDRLEFVAWRRADGGAITVAEIDGEAVKSKDATEGSAS
jgi:hypothetical protein